MKRTSLNQVEQSSCKDFNNANSHDENHETDDDLHNSVSPNNPKKPRLENAQDAASDNEIVANGDSAEPRENHRDGDKSQGFTKNPVAVEILLKYLPVRDWVALETVNKSWRGAVFTAWKKRRALNGKELAVGIRSQNGPQLKWRSVSHCRLAKDRRTRMGNFRDWILARFSFSALHEVRDIFTPCFSQSGDNVPAYIVDEFLKFEHLKSIDFSQCSPHLTAVARLLEELGKSLEEVDISSGMLTLPCQQRDFTGALYSNKGKPSDIGLAETNGTLQRCFKSLENIKSLNVSHCELANGLFLCSLPNPQKLRYLNISYSPSLKYKEITNSGFFLRCTNLERLEISLGKSDDKMTKVKLVLPSLANMTRLKHLVLAGWETTKGLTSSNLSQTLGKLTQLRSLSLENTKGLVKDDFMQDVCARLTKLERLEISVSSLNHQGFQPLKTLPRLKTLKLSMAVPKLMPKEAFHVLASIPSLDELDMGVPAYGTDMTGLYAGCEGLKSLKIAGMAATDELLLEWSQKLPKSVVHLHVKAASPEDAYRRQGTTPPGDSGLVAVLTDRGSELKSLFLARTNVSDVGLRKIDSCCSKLTEFGLYGTKSMKFTAGGVQALIDGCPKLECLYFDGAFKQKFGEDVIIPPLVAVKDFV